MREVLWWIDMTLCSLFHRYFKRLLVVFLLNSITAGIRVCAHLIAKQYHTLCSLLSMNFSPIYRKLFESMTFEGVCRRIESTKTNICESYHYQKKKSQMFVKRYLFGSELSITPLYTNLCGTVWLAIEFMEEVKTFGTCSLKQALDICVAINNLFNGRMRFQTTFLGHTKM